MGEERSPEVLRRIVGGDHDQIRAFAKVEAIGAFSEDEGLGAPIGPTLAALSLLLGSGIPDTSLQVPGWLGPVEQSSTLRGSSDTDAARTWLLPAEGLFSLSGPFGATGDGFIEVAVASGEDAVVCTAAPDGLKLLHLTRDHAQAFAYYSSEEDDDALDELLARVAPASTISKPPLPLEPWLEARVLSLADGAGPLNAAAAIGVALRLHSPPPENVHEALEVARRGEESAGVKWAREFLETLGPGALARLEQVGTVAAGKLLQSLSSLDDGAARALLEGRDELQSLLAVLELGGRGQELHKALQSLDEETVIRSSEWEDLLGGQELDRDWLAAVSWQEPQLWWAALG